MIGRINHVDVAIPVHGDACGQAEGFAIEAVLAEGARTEGPAAVERGVTRAPGPRYGSTMTRTVPVASPLLRITRAK